MSDEFKIGISASSGIVQALAALQGRGQAIDKAKPVIAEMMLAAVSDMFDAQGPGWAPLALSTIHARRGVTHMILQDTGLMAGSGTPAYGHDFIDIVFGASYAGYHAPDPQGRDISDLGPFGAPLLDEVATYLATVVAS